MLRKILVTFLFTPFLCFAGTHTTFVGKWIHIKYPSLRLEVSQNDTDMLVTQYKEKAVKKFPAKISEGALKVSNGPMSTSIVIETKTGHLLYNGQEYRRLGKNESFDYKEPAIPRF